jgi:hypothetical protein
MRTLSTAGGQGRRLGLARSTTVSCGHLLQAGRDRCRVRRHVTSTGVPGAGSGVSLLGDASRAGSWHRAARRGHSRLHGGLGTIVDNDRNGTFSCSAKVLQVGPLTSTTANPANSPCVDDSHTLAQVTLVSGLVSVQSTVLNAQTNLTPDNQSTAPANGDGATAKATVQNTKITVGLLTIEIGEITATATATCVGGSPSFAGSSTIASIKINGVPVAVPIGSNPVTIPLVIGSLKLNSTTTTGTSVTQQAVVLHTLLTDVVISQAHADVEGTSAHPAGNPCQA